MSTGRETNAKKENISGYNQNIARHFVVFCTLAQNNSRKIHSSKHSSDIGKEHAKHY